MMMDPFHSVLCMPVLVGFALESGLVWSGTGPVGLTGVRFRPFLCLQNFRPASAGRVMGWVGRLHLSGGWQWSVGPDSTHGTTRIRFTGGSCFVFVDSEHDVLDKGTQDKMCWTGRRYRIFCLGSESNPIRTQHRASTLSQ